MPKYNFVCDFCGKEFGHDDDEWFEQGAEQECKDIYGYIPEGDDLSICCTECHNRLLFIQMLRNFRRLV